MAPKEQRDSRDRGNQERRNSRDHGDRDQRVPREMSERDVQEHAWVDEWLRGRSDAGQYPPLEWKQFFWKFSKTLSYFLRHGAAEQGLTVRPDGCLPVADLFKKHQFRDYTEEHVEVAVKNNAKQRFGLKREDGVLLIFARQGHSSRVGEIDHSLMLQPLQLEDIPALEPVVHSTFWSNLPLILKGGLKIMGREHIHMAAGLDATSGIRKESDTILVIAARQAIADGVKFFKSENGVILTEGWHGALPPEYIERVMDRHGRTVPERNLPMPLPRARTAAVAQPSQPSQPSQGSGYASAAQPSQPAQASSSQPTQQSQLTQTEKDFLKVVKKFRGILKIKEEKAAGKSIEKTQEKKLESWDEVLNELREIDQRLSAASELREKNTDVLRYL